MTSGGWNKGIDSRSKHICNYCSVEYIKYKSSNSKYCGRECFYKSVIGHRWNNGRKQSDEEKEKRRIGNLRRYEKYGYINSPKTREKLRLAIIKYQTKIRDGMPTNLGKYEKQILDNIAKLLGYKILRQYQVAGYFLDGYIPKLNLAIEVDENYHKNRVDKDIERENYIKSKLNCKFVRIGID